MNLDIFNSSIVNMDFQRTNMFTVAIGSGPGSKYVNSFENFINPLFGNTWVDDIGSSIGFGISNLSAVVDNEINTKLDGIFNRSTTGSKIMAAMQSKVVQSFLGELNVGQSCLDYFNSTISVDNSVKAVKIPETQVMHQYQWNDSGPRQHKIGRRADNYFTITFRRILGPKNIELRDGSDNYIVWQEYVNMVKDQDNLRFMADDIECTVQINELDRSGIPHTAHLFEGCIPIQVGELNFDYDENNTIQTFEVTFAFTTHYPARVGEVARADYIEQFAAGLAGYAGRQLSGIATQYGNQIKSAAGNLASGLLSTGNKIFGGSGGKSSILGSL